MKKYIYFAVLFLTIIIGCSALSYGREEAAGLGHIQTFTSDGGRFGQVYLLYQSSGLADYIAMRALLWSENNLHRTELLKKFPTVNTLQLPVLAGAIQQLLTEYPADPACLVMAGDLHMFLNQKETAGWYYRQAQNSAPESELAKLALADFYLYQRQPEQVKELLQDSHGPLYALRLGEACLQLEEYTSALGYLLQAKPLPSSWQAIRTKDLAKTYLTLGEIVAAQNLLQGTTSTAPVTGVLIQEYKGWAAVLAGKDNEARSIWDEGRTIDPDYKFWISNALWLPISRVEIQNPPDLRDKDINSSLKLLQGQVLASNGEYNSAYQAYLSGIKSDHSSLIGFLGAASMQFKAGKDLTALDLCNQGLAVNSRFEPLVLKKLEILRKLGRIDEADILKSEFNKTFPASTEKKTLETTLLSTESGQSYLLVKGQTGSLTGFWVGAGGMAWEWYPAWGGPIYLRTAYSKAWVLPTGYGISGEAYYVQTNREHFKFNPVNMAVFSPEEIQLRYPDKVSITLAMESQGVLNISVQAEFAQTHHIPRRLFPGQGRLTIHYQFENGCWGSHTLELPALKSEAIPKPTPHYSVTVEPITNHRLIEIQFAEMEGESSDDTEVSIEEEGNNPEWQPFQKRLSFLLSEGDGLKHLTIQFRNTRGIFQEEKPMVELDTTPLKPESLEMMDTIGGIILKWRIDKPGQCILKVFTTRGEWQETIVTPDVDGLYTGFVSMSYSVFAEIIMKDLAGNTMIITDDQLTNRLQQINPPLFQMQEDSNVVNPNFILIKPVGDLTLADWAISNDLTIWSPWFSGMKEVKWRIIPGAGQRLIYLKYRLPNQPLIQYQVVQLSSDRLTSFPIPGEGER